MASKKLLNDVVAGAAVRDANGKRINTTYATATDLGAVATDLAGVALDVSNLSSGKIDKSSIADNLTTDDATKVLSAKQGKAIKTALDAKADLENGKIPASQLPSYVDDVIEFSPKNAKSSQVPKLLQSELEAIVSLSDFDEAFGTNVSYSSDCKGVCYISDGTVIPDAEQGDYYEHFATYVEFKSKTGGGIELKTSVPLEKGKIYLDTTTNVIYRVAYPSWTRYVETGTSVGPNPIYEISASLALGETSSTAFPGNRGLALETAVAGKQATIDSSHKLSSDLVDDTNATNLFVTASEKTAWNGKQDALTFDASPTASSDNPVKSGGVYSAIAEAASSAFKPKGSATVDTLNAKTYTSADNASVYVMLDSGDLENEDNSKLSVTEGEMVTFVWDAVHGYRWNEFVSPVDLSGLVDLSSDQSITGKKTFVGTQQIAFKANANTNSAFVIAPDSNGYNAKIGFSGQQIMFSSASVTFMVSAVPSGNSLNLGSATSKWANVYVSGSISDGTNSITVAQMVAKQNALTFDSSPTASSDNPVKSGGIYTALAGKADLDANGKVPSSQLPSYVDDVLEYASESNFPATGETGKIYVDTTANKTFRWGGSSYVEISASLALGTTSSTAYRGDLGAALATAVSGKQNALPTVVNGKFLHANSSTGSLEWADAPQEMVLIEYDVTPFDDVMAYINAGKLVACSYSDALFLFSEVVEDTDDYIYLRAIGQSDGGDTYLSTITIEEDDTYSIDSINLVTEHRMEIVEYDSTTYLEAMGWIYDGKLIGCPYNGVLYLFNRVDGDGNIVLQSVDTANHQISEILIDQNDDYQTATTGFRGIDYIADSDIDSESATSGQVLTADGSGGASWASVSAGMSNPMSAAGDLIVGGSSGTPTRLAKGSANDVFAMNALGTGQEWRDPNTLTPITSEGDLIVGGAGGYPERLAKGTSGQILKVGSSGLEWGSAPSSVTVDSTITQNGTNPVQGSAIYSALGGKQDTLVSGTSIKTVNGSSVLGNGNVSIGDSVALGVLTTAPSAANTSGIKIVVLSSEPATKYDGYLYIITGSNS